MCALTFNKPIFCANQEKRENGKDLKYYHCLGRCQVPWPSKALSKLHYLAIPSLLSCYSSKDYFLHTKTKYFKIRLFSFLRSQMLA